MERRSTRSAERAATAAATPGRDVAAHLFRLDRRRYAVEHQATLGAADLRLLWLLSDGTARTLREISETLDLEQSTVNRQVNKAIRSGHLHRYTESAGQAALVAPTPEGRARLEQDIALVMRLYDQALESLGDESGEFLRLLGRFVAGYEEAVANELRR